MKRRTLEHVLSELAILAEELECNHGATETKVRITVYSEDKMEDVVKAMESVIHGNTTANGDSGWRRAGDFGLDVVVDLDDRKPF